MSKFSSLMNIFRSRKFQVNLSRVALLLSTVTATTVWASAGDTYVINCKTCSTASDFVTAAKQAAWNSSYWKIKCDHTPVGHDGSGIYVVASQSYPLTAIVDIRGYVGFTAGGGGYLCNTGLHITSATAVDTSGRPMKNDAEMSHIEGWFWGGSRTPTKLGKIDISPDLAPSPASPADFEGVMSNAVSSAISAQLNINVAAIPNGTIIEVVWSDGSKGKFVKATLMPTALTWQLIPGTLVNKKGQRINIDGSLVTQPPAPVSSTPPQTVDVTATPNPTNPGVYSPNPTGIVIVTQDIPTTTSSDSVIISTPWSDGSTTVDTVFVPVGGGP